MEHEKEINAAKLYTAKLSNGKFSNKDGLTTAVSMKREAIVEAGLDPECKTTSKRVLAIYVGLRQGAKEEDALNLGTFMISNVK